ncbi:thermonuclease family protein [Chryseomicrobium palamuruense]|uniref:Thermonuclease family protein n=1 Tax=Chryseomicrobium palamuruense TaxID=682973 RepID=A0ABV8UW72_9BACL
MSESFNAQVPKNVWLDNVYHNQDYEMNGETYVEGEKLGMLTINELLLREGLAQVAIYPPNTEYVDQFEAVQKEAKSGSNGMWK